MRLCSVHYISVDSSTCFGCRHPSSGARTTVITACGTAQLGLPPSAEQRERMLVDPVDQCQKLTVVRSPDDGCPHPKRVELSTEM